jgi:hypothetical protein
MENAEGNFGNGGQVGGAATGGYSFGGGNYNQIHGSGNWRCGNGWDGGDVSWEGWG